jgi:multidrug resistance protein MdtO
VTRAPPVSLGAHWSLPRWIDFWRDELAPTPGRFNAMARIVVATTIVLVTSMTLEVPSVAVSLFIVLFLTKVTSNITTQNSVAVAIVGVLAIFVATIACVLTLLILDATIDYPGLRLAAMAVFLFLAMFVFRVFKLGQAGFIVAIIVLVSQAYVDLFPGPELIVRAVLWIWVAVVYPAVVAIGVNMLLLPADPEPLLRQEAAARLRAVARALAAPPRSVQARDAADALAEYATQGPAALLKLIRLAELQDSAVAPLHVERAAKVHLLSRLVESAGLLAGVTARRTPEEEARLRDLAAECERYAAASGSMESGVSRLPATARARSDATRSAATPIIDEIERVVRELPRAERPAVDEPAEGGVFASDILTNRAYAQFAFKVTLAAMFCYVFYTAVDWPGIHTCMITCVIVALGSAGATIHKSALRLLGCAVGGTLALVAIVFVIPKMASIASLMLLVAAVAAPAAWTAMGSERTAYLGVQLAFTFYLATLQGFAPSADLTEFRDRFVGIVFGVVVMTLVFAFVWPERAGEGAGRSLAAALRRMAELARGLGDPRAQRAAAWRALDEADRLRELSEFEPEALNDPGDDRARQLHWLVDRTRPVLLAQGVLAEHRLSARDAGMDSRVTAAFDNAVATVLAGVADRVENGGKHVHADLRIPLAALRLAAIGDLARDEVALCETVTDRVETLQQAAGLV